MSIYTVISNFKLNAPRDEESAERFLANLSSLKREQLIAAIYLGREHIHCAELRSDSDIEISRSYTDHITNNEYARILYEKGDNAVAYLDKLVECAKASGFDLDAL